MKTKSFFHKPMLVLFWGFIATNVCMGIALLMYSMGIDISFLFPKTISAPLPYTVTIPIFIGSVFVTWWSYFVLARTRKHLSNTRYRWFWTTMQILGIIVSLALINFLGGFFIFLILKHIPIMHTRGIESIMGLDSIQFVFLFMGIIKTIYALISVVIIGYGYWYYTIFTCNIFYIGDINSPEMNNYRFQKRTNLGIAFLFCFLLTSLLFSILGILINEKFLWGNDLNLPWYLDILLFIFAVIFLLIFLVIRFAFYQIQNEVKLFHKKNNLKKFKPWIPIGRYFFVVYEITILILIIALSVALLFSESFFMKNIPIIPIYMFLGYIIVKNDIFIMGQEIVLHEGENKIKAIRDNIPDDSYFEIQNGQQKELLEEFKTLFEGFEDPDTLFYKYYEDIKTLYFSLEKFEEKESLHNFPKLLKTVRNAKKQCVILAV